ncbi:MAG: patatin-like phospholipase family protein [Patescibacteria group bacterium]|jgi:predicted patatin/cPLA2 family phospholipase
MPKRALVVGLGGLRGAYDAGVLATLCRTLGPTYFDAIYASSVGVFSATFYAAGQADVIEHTWRHRVDGTKLVNMFNVFKKRKVLDLAYLIDIFQREESYLDVERILHSHTKLIYVLTRYPSGEVAYQTPTHDNLFELMRGSAAMPFIHGPVRIHNDLFIDGGLTDPVPVIKALEDGYEDITLVYNKPAGFFVSRRYALSSLLMSLLLPRPIGRSLRNLKGLIEHIEMTTLANPHISVIRPSAQIPIHSILDADKARLNATIDLGIADAKKYTEHLHSA